MDLLAVEGRAQFVRRDRDRRERGLAFALQKAEALGEFAGMRLRKLTSLTSMISRISGAACAGVAPCGTSVTITATSASRSMPQAVSAARIGSRGPMNSSEAPRYISGSVQNVGGTSAPRAWRTSAT